jgi:hypothetical protein
MESSSGSIRHEQDSMALDLLAFLAVFFVSNKFYDGCPEKKGP